MNWCCMMCDFTSFHALYFIAWLEIIVQFFSLSPQLSGWFFVLETTMLGSTDTFLGVYIYHHHLTLLPFPDICLWNPELSYFAFIHSWLIGIHLTLWYQMLHLCNAQCDALNTKCHINISALMQPPFKFWSFADYCRHLILALGV